MSEISGKVKCLYVLIVILCTILITTHYKGSNGLNPTATTLLATSAALTGDKRIKMGVKNSLCDDGMTSLEVDWLDDPQNYTCYGPELPLAEASSELSCDQVPDNHSPKHFCMNTTLTYSDLIPSFGDHRPLWPVFGEYKFVPVQRWSHSIEHGTVILLYHPCTNPALVDKLRKMVTGCIRKHIITPYQLSTERPLALVAWGCRLEMTGVNESEVINFIREKGLKGPEGKYSKEGQYTHRLIKKAEIPTGSDVDDSVLCPSFP